MRKFLMLMVLCAALVGFAARPGHAATLDVSGSYSGTERWHPDPCGIARSFTDATGTISPLGASTISLEICVTVISGFALAPGTPLTLTTDDGSLSGHVTSGTLALNFPLSAVFTADVTIDGGTGAFSGATGTLTVTGTANAGFGPPDTDVPATGTITGEVTTPDVPTSIGQCMHGGWRNVVNNHGQPFTNQGLCIAFVVAHQHN